VWYVKETVESSTFMSIKQYMGIGLQRPPDWLDVSSENDGAEEARPN
jgi:hypothetical protein